MINVEFNKVPIAPVVFHTNLIINEPDALYDELIDTDFNTPWLYNRFLPGMPGMLTRNLLSYVRSEFKNLLINNLRPYLKTKYDSTLISELQHYTIMTAAIFKQFRFNQSVHLDHRHTVCSGLMYFDNNNQFEHSTPILDMSNNIIYAPSTKFGNGICILNDYNSWHAGGNHSDDGRIALIYNLDLNITKISNG